MNTESQITILNTTYDCSNAVRYHLGGFPPPSVDLDRLLSPLIETTTALTRYDTLLQNLPNSELLLAPLRARDAVISSRMEGHHFDAGRGAAAGSRWPTAVPFQRI